MSLKKFLFFLFLQLAAVTGLKIWFFASEIFANPGLQEIIFWLLMAVASVAIVRRLGVINYLEAIFTAVVWTLAGLFVDLIITTNYTGLTIFLSVKYWIGFGVMAVGMFMFHKKRHVHIRHELRAKEHGQKH